MSLRLVYRRRVGRDLSNAFAYYEEQVEALGERFLSAVDSAFDAIERYPEMFAKVHRDVRRAIIFAVSVRGLLPHRTRSRHRLQGTAYRARSAGLATVKEACALTVQRTRTPSFPRIS